MCTVAVYCKALLTLPGVVAEPSPITRTPPRARQEWAITLAHQYHPEVFVHPLPGTAVAFVLDAQDRVIGHAAGVREPRDGDCVAVVDRLVPAFQASKWSSGGCAVTADRGAVVIFWKKLKQAQGSGDVSAESMVDERPVFLSGPPLQYPPLLRQAGIQGTVLVRAIIDSRILGAVPAVREGEPFVREVVMGAVLDLVRVLFEPTAVFERVREKPRFLAPFLALAALTVVIVVLQLPYTKAALAVQLAQTPNLTPDKAETAMRIGPIIGLVAAPLFVGVFLLVNALILWVSTSVLGGEAKFVTLLSVTTYAGITYTLLQVIGVVVLTMRGAGSI